jgi:hypothetical protein
MTPGAYWMLKHRKVYGICLLSGEEVKLLWEAGAITAEIATELVVVRSLDDFLAKAQAAKKEG